GVGIAVVATAFVVGGRTTSPVELCEASGALSEVWPAGDQASALARIAGLGAYGRQLAPQLELALRDHAARWFAVRHRACAAHDNHTESDALFDRQIACLERGRAALAEVAGITAHADTSALSALVYAVHAIPDPAKCGGRGLVCQGAPPPPRQAEAVERLRGELARARVQLAAARITDAEAAAVDCVVSARALGYRPVLAEALLVEGRVKSIGERAR